MNTIGTNDDTVKFHGVRSVEKINFSERKDISFDLDWNNQSNGAYLTGGVYLCPDATNENPGNEKDWLKFEYGDEIFASPHDLSFTSAYIYLQMSSHSNYPDREIYFDNVLIDD